ncbi:MAG: PilZ domain-containing protein [Candidatus Omnitrophica bacterium]|nr:PilZ domain-containing protein [Candidatus Omnitrophota bacterium]
MEDHSESRKYVRVTTHIPVKYRKLTDSIDIEKTGTITRNLSEGGVYFKADEFISMACRLILELDMPMFTKPVKAISKVAWIKKSRSGEDYEIGNQFLEISKQDRALVSEYVNSLALYNGSGEGSISPEQTTSSDA